MRLARLTILALLLAGTATAAETDKDRRLQGMAVIGNQELPKSLYIVPWKRSELGTAAPTPSSGLFSEGLGPVDPEVFRREIDYHEAVQANRQ